MLSLTSLTLSLRFLTLPQPLSQLVACWLQVLLWFISRLIPSLEVLSKQVRANSEHFKSCFQARTHPISSFLAPQHLHLTIVLLRYQITSPRVLELGLKLTSTFETVLLSTTLFDHPIGWPPSSNSSPQPSINLHGVSMTPDGFLVDTAMQ